MPSIESDVEIGTDDQLHLAKELDSPDLGWPELFIIFIPVLTIGAGRLPEGDGSPGQSARIPIKQLRLQKGDRFEHHSTSDPAGGNE